MTKEISRRRLLRDTALISGGAVLLGGLGSASASALSVVPQADSRAGSVPSNGLFSQREYGDARGESLVGWTRAGGSSSLQLTQEDVRFEVPTRGRTVISLADFEAGRGHDDIRRHFGAAALEQLTDHLRVRRIFAA